VLSVGLSVWVGIGEVVTVIGRGYRRSILRLCSLGIGALASSALVMHQVA